MDLGWKSNIKNLFTWNLAHCAIFCWWIFARPPIPDSPVLVWMGGTWISHGHRHQGWQKFKAPVVWVLWNLGHMSVWRRARSGVIANSCSPTPANCPPQPLCSPVFSRQTRPSWESQLQSSQKYMCACTRFRAGENFQNWQIRGRVVHYFFPCYSNSHVHMHKVMPWRTYIFLFNATDSRIVYKCPGWRHS